MSTETRNSAQTSSYLIPGQHYLETFMPLSNSNQNHTFMGDYIIPVLKQQTRLLLCLQRLIFCSDIQHCLNCSNAHSTQAFSCYNSLSTQYLFPSFLPSYETCSIKVPFILAAIKPSWKPYGIFIISPYFPSNIARN